MKSDFKVGAEYRVEFWDHCEDGPVMRFVVFGRCKSRNKGQVELASWDYASPGSDDEPENVKTFSIVRAAIVSVEKLTATLE